MNHLTRQEDKLAKKKAIATVQQVEPEQLQPNSPAEFLHRAWLFYSRQKYSEAQADFEAVLSQEAGNFDAQFGLSLALKFSGDNQQALAAFEKTLTLVESIEERQRASIMLRLVRGHINQIKSGDWNLEKEVWQTDH